MADRILFIGWNRPIAGREQKANQVFQKSMEFYSKLQAEGRIDSFEPVLLTAHGGDLNGFIMIKGEAGKLADLREDDAFIDLVMEAEYCVGGIGVVPGYIGEGLTDVLGRWLKLIGE